MKSTNSPLLLLAVAALSLGFAGTTFGFTAVTNLANVTNDNSFGGPGLDIGDTFVVTGGTFASYTPDAGDPTITGGDLHLYKFNLSGEVNQISGGSISSLGLYEIFYDGNNDFLFAGGSDFTYSSGRLELTVDYNSGSGLGPYSFTGIMNQTAGPDPVFHSSGFSRPQAVFSGEYTQNSPTNSDPGNGAIGGTIRSVPDGGSSLVLLGIAAVGTFLTKRKLTA